MTNFSALSSSPVVSVLAAVDSAIRRAYDLTNTELQVKRLDKRAEKTLRPQLLHHNVNQQVCDLGGMYPDLLTDLPPNRRGSHHHVIAAVENVLMTVSTVPTPYSVPRYAGHRSRYALRQRYFRMAGSGLEIVPVPDPCDGRSLYIQVLHGPEPGHGLSHGFTVLRMLDVNDQYLPDIIDLDEHLASVAAVQADHELITEDFQVVLAVPKGEGQNALW